MIETDLLKTFLTLVETRHFTAAARKLRRSQSAISLQVGKLELLLGKKLFLRDNRNVGLTMEGEQLVGYAKQMLKLEREMISHFQQPHVEGEVIFGMPEDLATAYLPGILADFAESYPKIFIQVHCEFSLHLLEGFKQGDYHLILVKEDPKNPHPGSEKVAEEELVWVAREEISLDALTPLPLVLAPAPCVYRQRALDALNREGIRWRMAYTSPSLAGALAAVRAGLGATILPCEMAPKDLAVLKKFPKLKDAQISLLKQPAGSEAIRQFALFVSSHLAEQTQFKRPDSRR